MVLKDNLKVSENTELWKDIDNLIDTIAHYIYKQEETINHDLFENLDTGLGNYSIMEEELGELIIAIAAQRVCTAKYQKVDSQKPVEIDFLPVKFLILNNAFYVLALDNDKREYHTYNLARFRPNSFTVHPDAILQFKMPKLNWDERKKKSFGIVYDKNVQKVKLEFLPRAVDYIKNRTWHFEPEITFRKNGNMIMEMEMGITIELVSWIMRWMPNVIVNEPDELKNKVKIRLERSLKNNKW